MRLFQGALDTPLDSPFSATLSVHGLHFTVCAPSINWTDPILSFIPLFSVRITCFFSLRGFAFFFGGGGHSPFFSRNFRGSRGAAKGGRQKGFGVSGFRGSVRGPGDCNPKQSKGRAQHLLGNDCLIEEGLPSAVAAGSCSQV